MEELHRIHKDVPFGYWTEWVAPALRAIARRVRDKETRRLPAGLDQLSAPH